ncbi:hypothetical protein JTB14_017567 [Gonioctena quinquepunctata]|nr:hypothetical protein JTB14_017567 [Gonioctena quinquepunctata]
MGITKTKPNESTDEIIKTIRNLLGKVRSYRLGKSPIGEKSPIKVEFELLHEKEALMRANRAMKPTTSDVKLEGPSGPIFMNHNMTKDNGELFKATRIFQKGKQL